MKKTIWIAALGSIVFLSICGCFGPSEKEEAAQKRKEDSLMEIERNNALNDADRLLHQSDSLEKIKQDSIDNAQKELQGIKTIKK
jgi:hypothetical protein